MYQAHLYISGLVQGVNYRNFMKANADKLGVKGWTRNLMDGRVEAVFQGDKLNTEDLVSLCRKGPSIAEVHEIKIFEEGVNEIFKEFSVKL